MKNDENFKQGRLIKNMNNFIKKKIESKDTLVILEENLDKCPNDHLDCIMFIMKLGLMKDPLQCNYGVIIFDEEESEKLDKLLSLDKIKVFVFKMSKNKGTPNKMWSILLTKERTNDSESQGSNKIFIGGEELRKFCDNKNIYYKTISTKTGSLLSGTTLMYLKDPGEDCRLVSNQRDNQ